MLYRQGDRSRSFYLVEKGEIEMSLIPDADALDASDNAGSGGGGDGGGSGGSGGQTLSRAIPVRSYTAGECFGASGLMQGDEFRRNTATAMTDVTLKVIPHKHFRAPAWSKWASWWRHSWPSRAPLPASEGVGLPSALGGRHSRSEFTGRPWPFRQSPPKKRPYLRRFDHPGVLLKDNHFLKAGLHATNVLRAKEEQAGSKRRAEGYNDEDDDEVVMRAKRR